MVGIPYIAQSQPEHMLAQWVGKRSWMKPMRTEHLQTYDGGLDIKPQRSIWAKRLLRMLKIPKKEYAWDILLSGTHDTAELQIRHAFPYPIFRERVVSLEHVGIALIAQHPSYRGDWKQFSALEGAREVITIDQQKYWYFRRPEDWFLSRQ